MSADGLFIGLMSGTSIDAVDAALVQIDGSRAQFVEAVSFPIPDALRGRLLALCEADSIQPEDAGRADREFGICLAEAALALLAKTGVSASEISAVGSHGQTIRHRPARPGTAEPGFSWQIGDPNSIAEQTGIRTVADFRRRDVAAGGQGAPLVPAFHLAAFGSNEHDRVVLNIGGMANVTLLPAAAPEQVRGFDTGPGNVLLDGWIRRHLNRDFDADGAWARSGLVESNLLLRLLEHPFFSLPAPKSTGREEFNLAWLEQQIDATQQKIRTTDVQATLVELTATSICRAVHDAMPGCPEVYLCGGGSRNAYLVERLATMLEPSPLSSTAVLGLDPDWVEASAFAWLAHRRLAGLPGNLPAVTGASKAVVLGGIYPGRA